MRSFRRPMLYPVELRAHQPVPCEGASHRVRESSYRTRQPWQGHSHQARQTLPGVPLFPHATRRWAKKIRGQIHYFGSWDDPDGVLKKYPEQKDALHAGKKPREAHEGLTVKELCITFLNRKQALVDSGELSPRTWREYKDTTDLLVSWLGKQ